MKKIIIVSVILLVGACNNFEFSPNQTFDRNSPRDLNAVNMARLAELPVDDTITIAFVGDSQRFYDQVERFVKKVNTISQVDFVLLAGDISDFGLLNEFEWVHKRLSKLAKPYIAVIGNHDVIANGENVFRRMYGPLDFSFVYDSVKFIIHNTNGREYPSREVPDLTWLEQELNAEPSDGVKHYIAVSHVPPTDGDFKQQLIEPYTALFRSTPGFLVSLHGHVHNHTDGYPFSDGVRYITSFSLDQPSFVLLKIKGNVILKEIIEY
jgi:3',5'-cyclic-AMP phosphodiesterase